YPAYNKQLIERVEKFGLVISEQPPDFEVKPWLFPVRNRIIAGLAEGVLVAAGKRDSGARHTATFALEGGKDVFAFPYSIGVSYGELPNSLIKSGAHLCDDVNDILETMRVDVKKVASVKLEGDEKNVFSLIKDGVILADDLVERSGLKSYEVATVLTKLELGGFIARAAGNTYKAIK
ncbi:MAG: DNA-protecting protein DprA, partial [Clostridia bacterium]|nr:DNA-protecting protein DprA [Clostridia bacterium]